MPFQPPLTPDNPDEEPLLTSDEFKKLVTRLLTTTDTRQAMCISLGSAIAVSAIASLWLHWYVIFITPILIIFCMIYTYIMYYLHVRSIGEDQKTVERLIMFLENTHDVKQVGAIIDLKLFADQLEPQRGRPYVISLEWGRLQEVCYYALKRLLPVIQSKDADDVNNQHRDYLRRWVSPPFSGLPSDYWRDNALCLPVLSALEQIGDKRDLPDIERLLKEHITEEIRAAAERCALVIRERLALEEGKDFLLRADRKPEAVEALLRPSTENADTPPQQLLRAATSDVHDPPV